MTSVQDALRSPLLAGEKEQPTLRRKLYLMFPRSWRQAWEYIPVRPQGRWCPEEKAGFFSRFTFYYCNSIIMMGYKRPLDAEDVWDLHPRDSTRQLSAAFQRGMQESKSAKYPAGNIWWALWAAHKPLWISSGIWIFILSCALFLQPYILEVLLYNLQLGGSSLRGFGLAVALWAASMLCTISVNKYFEAVYRLTMHLKAALIDMIYRKTLTMSSAAKGRFGVGTIINLQSNDAYKLWMMVLFLHAIWYGPLQIIVVLLLLFRIIGVYASLAGMAVTIAFIPITSFIGAVMSNVRSKLMKATDERVKLTTEIMLGIKAIKLYAWEGPYSDRILALREVELRHIRDAALCTTFNFMVFLGGPILVSIAGFATYSALGNVLTAEVAFPALAYFNLLRIPMAALPDQIQQIINGQIAVKRLQRFVEEADRPVPPLLPAAKPTELAVCIRDGRFSWSETSEPVLQDVQFAVPAGKLVMVVGSVGAGKTSLLQTLLGELHTQAGTVLVRGTTAYTAQDPWIQNATLRDNVTMMDHFDAKKYNRIIANCAMLPDISMLPASDATEIGEKGVNLSGGQRHRVALARACYADADVYLLDDPLSAVDAHVGRHLFDKVICGELSGKTRILVTHQVQFISGADYVAVVNNNRVAEFGTYEELIAKGLDFAQYHIEEAAEEEEVPAIPLDAYTVPDSEPAGSSSSELAGSSSEGGASASDEDEVALPVSRERVSISRERVSRDGRPGLTAERSRVSFNVADPVKKVDDGKVIKVEERAVGKVESKMYFTYLAHWSPFFTLPILLIISSVADRGMQQVQNLWLSIWTNSVAADIEATGTTTRDTYFMYIYLVLGFVSLAANFIRQIALVYGSVNASRGLHANLLRKVLRLPMSFFDSQPTGRLLNRFSRDIEAIDIMLITYWNNVLTTSINCIAAIVAVAGVAPYVLLIIAPCLLFYYALQTRFLTTSRELKRLDSLAFSPIFANFSETLVGLTSLRAFRREDQFLEKNCELLNESNRMYWPMQLIARWLGVRLEMLGNTIVLGTAILVATALKSSAGLAGLALTSAINMTQQLNWMARNISDLEVSMNGVERLVEYTELTPEKPAIVEKNRPPASWPSQGAISVEGLWVRYRADRDPVLKGLTFSVNGREKVGVAGRTGCGKSTLMMALYRMVEPSGGRIVIDGINTLEIGTFDLRSKLALVPQDPVIFSGSVRENLDPFGSSGGDAAIWEALKQAGMADTINAMAGGQGLDSVISEGGGNLSTGQRQLLCMARALLRRSRILILDEATSNVDNTTDSLIQTTIRSAFRDCTTLTIAHRLHTIIDSDRVLVLEAGEVLEFDSPQNLMKDPTSAFYGLVQSTKANEH